MSGNDDAEKRHARPGDATPREPPGDGQAVSPAPASPADETASMLPAGAAPPQGAPRPAEGAAFPVPGWDRYQHVGFLGQGGMGRVFLAYDARLRRQVALKFVRDDHPEYTQRFLSEARAQAKVNHDRVCKVYEVGQVDQKFFIAMQYVDGKPLSAFVRELSVEQKALVLRDAALGVHEAHRAGLIHRDLKPANIMVERGEDGALRPYVMDFGLARDWSESTTATGSVLGTPHYMAPEQARGEVARLDRRADVYSLGATLYALLTGQPPIQGSNSLEVINNLAILEPRPPRALDPDIPPDLEAIALKCLEKEPAARYDSARALAEDLDRFLAGEPVLARTGPGYRLLKRLRKHRRAALAATAALLAVAVTAGWAITARREATERERLSRRFTELVERLESRARYSALSRLHDAREDREAIQAIQAQMEALETEIQQGGEWAIGPGNYALGRSALVLGDPDKARNHLELAWQHGFREPRVAYALGLALGIPYQRELPEAERGFDPEWRQARLRELERRHRDPALAYLKQSQGAEEPSAEYIAALIAFYEGRLDDALALLDTVSAKQPWFYEASLLRGDIFVVRVYRRWIGGDLDGAKADVEAGRKAYGAAATIAESVPAVHQGMAQLEVADMVLHQHDDAMPAYARAQDAFRRCFAVAPDDYTCWAGLGRLHFFMSQIMPSTRNEGGHEAEAVIAKAIEAAERALALAPARPEARMVLARSFHALALSRSGRDEDPREQLRKATDMLESIRLEDRTRAVHVAFATVFDTWASHLDRMGENPLSHRDSAIRAWRAALAIDDRVSYDWFQLGNEHSAQGFDRRNPEPERDLAQAELAYEKARSGNPGYLHRYRVVGAFYVKRARWLRSRGGDPTPDLVSALEQYRQALTINPRSYDSLPGSPRSYPWHLGIGEVLKEQARETWERGEDPFPLLDQALAAFERARSSAPEELNKYGRARNDYDLKLGALLAQRARYQRTRGEDPGPSVRQAEELVKRGPGPWQEDPDLLVTLGSIHVIQAGFNVDRGRAPGPDLARAEEELRRALAHKPDERGIFLGNRAGAWLQLGEARSLRARWQARTGEARAEDFEEAVRSYEKAIELEPDELDHRLRLGHHCAAWATWRKQAGAEHGPVSKRGLELADQLLKLRPRWTEAQALRDSLLQLSP